MHWIIIGIVILAILIRSALSGNFKESFFGTKKQNKPWLIFFGILIGAICVILLLAVLTAGCSDNRNQTNDYNNTTENTSQNNGSNVELQKVESKYAQELKNLINSAYDSEKLPSQIISSANIMWDQYQSEPLKSPVIDLLFEKLQTSIKSEGEKAMHQINQGEYTNKAVQNRYDFFYNFSFNKTP